MLAQAEAATEAARRVSAHPLKPCFTMGFLTGHELRWMPEALRILRDELPNVDVMISSQYSPLLADWPIERENRCSRSTAGERVAGLALPSSREVSLRWLLPIHRLAAFKSIDAKDLQERDICDGVENGSGIASSHRQLL